MYIYFFEQRAKLLLFCGVFRNCLITLSNIYNYTIYKLCMQKNSGLTQSVSFVS